MRQTLDRGHALLQGFDRPANPRHHFVVDPDKFDFYAMDYYRVVGDNDLATAHAREVLRCGRGPNGEDLAPMRMAEARIALGCVAARNGDLDEAVDHGTRAFDGERKCFPSLLHAAGELDSQIHERYAGAPKATAFHQRLRAVRTEQNTR